MKEYEIILDTDIGDDIDDAYALALLMAENAKLLGITTVYRNAVQRAKIASRLTALWNRHIPVYAGKAIPKNSRCSASKKRTKATFPTFRIIFPQKWKTQKSKTAPWILF